MKLTENWKTLETAVAQVVAKAWIDDEFRKRFVSAPREILREAGLVVEDFVNVVVNQGSTGAPALKTADGGAMIYEINLPAKPTDLTDAQIGSWVQEAVSDDSPVPACC
ncbi:MAG: hypothetical protein F6J90_02285 [Moorea sp. SIOASIH]|uniref:hypothetical protein n=1 Tax=Moorena sp. SIOASIH TaxID=2607817 RepID=UPI0013BB2A73|nr:hypothetical protein [Moorena sp. SIOASIH]NEO35199.1 hypothetical protein [Moorena sp. SIOASIH]